MRGLPRWSVALLVVVTLVGGLLRFEAASEPSARQSADELSYAKIARSIVDNGTYGLYGPGGQSDPIHWPPGAPVLFAVAYALDGETRADEPWDVPAAYPWQAAVGTATIVAAFLLVLFVAGPLAGLLAATVVAFYPPLITASSDLLSEPLGALLVTSAMAAVVLTLRDLSWRPAVLAGLLLAGTVLTRADLLLVPVIALVTVAAVGWSRAGDRRLRAGVRAALPMLAALLVVVLPWTVFASSVAGKLVPLSSGGASNLWVGTYLPGDGSIFGAKHGMEAEVKRRLPQLSDREPFQLAGVHVIRTVAARHPELDQEAALRKEVMFNLREYALGQPVDFAAMMARKVWRLWGNYTLGGPRNRVAAIRAAHIVIVGLSFAGIIAGLVATRRPELWMLLALVLYVTALNAVLVSEARHNLAIMPVVAGAGAIGAWLAVARMRARAASHADGRAAPVPAASERVTVPASRHAPE